MRWKALLEMEKQQFEQVDRNIKEAQEKLEAEMEAAQHEHQVMLMRQGESGPWGTHASAYRTKARLLQGNLPHRPSITLFVLYVMVGR